MITPRADMVIVPVCLSLVAVSAAVLALLRDPDSRLSRWVDRSLDAPFTDLRVTT